jgi:hypothetical protein
VKIQNIIYNLERQSPMPPNNLLSADASHPELQSLKIAAAFALLATNDAVL